MTVFTGDAAGNMGGGWWRHKRMAFVFPDDERAPCKSSNFRELKLAVAMVERWGAANSNGRILIRTDNTTTAAVVNKLVTDSPDLSPLCQRLIDVSREHNVDVKARHIPGLKNILADRLSRELFLHTRDTSDLMLRPDEYQAAVQQTGPRPSTPMPAQTRSAKTHTPPASSPASTAASTRHGEGIRRGATRLTSSSRTASSTSASSTPPAPSTPAPPSCYRSGQRPSGGASCTISS